MYILKGTSILCWGRRPGDRDCRETASLLRDY